ncbi:MAG: hypothetical protein PF904_02570 [Kiritimatiellae bacterium]|jgi:hypothetical protein|nr:hypothetical protein [Kiritimatiellia bacterium]
MENKDPKISEAIEFFETMLESMPGDRTSLEFLVVAYEQVGALDKRCRCLIDLVDTLIKEGELNDAKMIAGHLKVFSEDSDAQAAVARLNKACELQALSQKKELPYEGAALEKQGDGSLNVPDPVIEVHVYSRAALSAEMDLVWMLKDNEILPPEICEELIRALSEYPVTENPQLISAMSFLDDAHPEWTEKVMCQLQKSSNMPAIPLELFDCEGGVLSAITSAYIKVRGVIPFAMMADEFLVGVMNPLDKALQEDLTARLGAKCHFFLVHPRIVQDVLVNKFDL